MRSKVFLFFLIAMCLGAVSAWAGPSGELRVGDVMRSYTIHVPAKPAGPAGYPVVLAFHGGGGRGARMVELMGLTPYADTRGFIVIYPDGIDRHWNDGRATIKTKSDDIGFVAALLDEVEKRFPVDTKRIFAMGISNGAVFSERVGCALAGRVSAIAAVSGTLAADLAPSCHPAQPLSVLQIAGTDDPIMPYGGGAVKQILGMGEGGTVLSADDTVAFWASQNGCAEASPPVAVAPIAPPDGTTITARHYGGCRANSTVQLLTVKGGGHAWPGGKPVLSWYFGRTSHQLDATRSSVEFFFARPSAD